MRTFIIRSHKKMNLISTLPSVYSSESRVKNRWTLHTDDRHIEDATGVHLTLSVSSRSASPSESQWHFISHYRRALSAAWLTPRKWEGVKGRGVILKNVRLPHCQVNQELCWAIRSGVWPQRVSDVNAASRIVLWDCEIAEWIHYRSHVLYIVLHLIWGVMAQ